MSTHEQRGKPRSYQQHKRFFAVCAAAFDHWPERHAFQPDNAEHLRSWLLVKAKHCVIQSFELSDDASEAASLVPIIMATMARQHCWARAKGNTLHVCVPQSISYQHVDHQAFQKINDDVDEIIRAETGLDPEQILRERGA